MKQKITYPIIVIGAGAGGLVVALGVARAGKKVLLIDRGTWGGDCTNFGCIPSKTLIACSKIAHSYAEAPRFGLEGGTSFASKKKVLTRVRSVVESIRAHENPEALRIKGVDAITGNARFLSENKIAVQEPNGNEAIFLGTKIVIATGSSPRIPNIPGLAETPYLTNESIFSIEEFPKSLCIVGGGPIGCELAQAFSRLGSKITLVHRHPFLLKKEEPEAQDLLLKKFLSEGIDLRLNAHPKSVHHQNELFHLSILSNGDTAEIRAESLLVAAGRKANINGLELGQAGVHYSESGIPIDHCGRTNRKHIYAIGDVNGGPKFTHAAENQARTVFLSLLLPFNKKMDKQPVPRTTFTDPEIASFGLLQEQAEIRYTKKHIKTYLIPLSENDRAITTGETEGFIKIVTKRMSSRILGATIVAPRAGEMIAELSLAAVMNIPLRKLSRLIHPYPTYNLAIRKAADLWHTQILFPMIRHPFKSVAWKRLIPLFLIILMMLTAYVLGIQKYLTVDMLKANHHYLKQIVADFPFLTPVLFIFVYILATSLSLPGGALLSVIGGYLFSVPWGTCYVLVGATAGASLIFLAARSAFRAIFKKMAAPFLKKMEKGFQKNAWSYLLFLRFVPLFPFWLVNIAPAFFQISFYTFLWTTFVGIIPGAYAYTQAGSGIEAILESNQPLSLSAIFNIQIRIALFLIGFIALLPVFLKKYFFRKK